MRLIKNFEEYIEQGIAKKISPDIQRAENLRQESKRKYALLQKQITQLGVDDDNANDYVEYCYNIILFLIRSRMLRQGFSSSGQGAHEAEVSFARIIGFSEPDIQLLDQLRYFRNGILYYGKRFDKEYAEKIIDFTKMVFTKLSGD